MMVYKYRPMDCHSRRVISDHELYFARPQSFNDPFDCALLSHLALNDKSSPATSHYYAVPSDVLEAIGTHNTLDVDEYINISQMLAWYIRRALDDERGQYVDLEHSLDKIANRIANLGILSMSLVGTSALMFSHYADAHRGLAFEFDIDLESAVEPFNEWHLVGYAAEMPTVDTRNAIELVTVKNCDWRYEREIRFVKKSYGVHKYEPAWLKRVIFGFKMSFAHKREIRDLVQRSIHKPELWQADRMEKGFDLHLRPATASDFDEAIVGIRRETVADDRKVRQAIRLACASRNDLAKHIETFRSDISDQLSLVAGASDRIVGFVLFYQQEILVDGLTIKAAVLAYLAVIPEWRGKELERELVRQGLEACRDEGCRLALVRGESSFFAEMGFSSDVAGRLRAPTGKFSYLAKALDPTVLGEITGNVYCPPPLVSHDLGRLW